jgi:hypothetical protein
MLFCARVSESVESILILDHNFALMPPTKTNKKRAADVPIEVPDVDDSQQPDKAARTVEVTRDPYDFWKPKDYSPDETTQLAESLGADIGVPEGRLALFSADASGKKLIHGKGFEETMVIMGTVSIYGPDGDGTYPNVRDIKAAVTIGEKDYERVVNHVVAQFEKHALVIAKWFSPGPDKNEFTKDPKAWTQKAIKDRTINLPVKRSEKYNDDGTIDRVNISFNAKAKITRKGAPDNAEEEVALASRMFGADVGEALRGEMASGKRFYLPPMKDAMETPIEPEKLFQNGRAKLFGAIQISWANLFVMEAKSQRVPNFSAVCLLNGITGVRVINSGSSAAPEMTDAQRVKLAGLL